ncbi:MAG: Holliday junction branch migration protein RuvA [Erysipelothrix sp.]|nr:Holliday junction branch migration protein RuvA [Erysipelothrix sp.]
MISFIKGTVYSKSEGQIVVECNNLGYLLYISDNDLAIGDEVFIHTYQHVREDEISLFGFLETLDRELFLMLITVKGVGPKTANNILAKANAKEISNAISNADINYLKKLPGIGAKSAQQIILDLKQKLVADTPTSSNSALDDALSGLKSLGIAPAELNIVKAQLKNKVMSTDEYLKAGLKLINQRKGG